MRAVQLVTFAVLAAAGAVPCLAQSLESKDGVNVAIERFSADARVDEGVALVEVDETFRNSQSVQREGVWRFRLPADAVVSSFSMWMNGVEKTGRVLEAGTARRVYDSIVRKRKDPGLLEQTGWRDFQVSVFPIPANDTVRIRLRYAFVLPDDLGLETLEVPLPVGCGTIGDLRVHAAFAAARGLATLDCPSHADAKVSCENGRGEASWSGDGVAPARAFVVRAVPKRDGFDVAVVATRAPEGGDGWFVARVVPRLAEPPKIARDVVFVVDRSGSMSGSKMEQARAALLRGIDTLKPGDRFDVISFSSDVSSLGNGGLLPADDANLERARRAAADLSASGGTNIAGALGTAVALRSSDATRFFAIVFLTDGDPTVGETNPGRILGTWRENAGSARLFAFGVGADVKDFLLTKLAALGRGAATYVKDDADLEVKLSSLVDAIRTPLLVDPEVSIDGDGVEILDREPARLPDVFQGRALVVSGRFHGAGKATLHLRGRGGAAAVDVAVPLDFASAADRPHVAQIWAKARVERLLDDLRVGGANAEIRAEIVKLGTRFQIVSPYTSFLVVEDGVRIPDAGEDARVPDQPGGPATGGAASGPSSGGGGGSGPTTGGSSHSGFGKRSGGDVPPDTREPSDPPLPGETREPSDPPPSPDGGGPSTPGGDSPGGPSTSGGSDSGKAKMQRTGSSRQPGYEDWTFWWQFAWDDVLAAAPAAPRVAPDVQTLTLLRTLLRDETASFRIRSRAALALGAMDDAESVADLVRLATSGTEHRGVIERAVLALGMLRRAPNDVRAALSAVLRDTTHTGTFARAYAAISLGLLHGDAAQDAAAAELLRGIAFGPEDPDPNVQPACLVALGLRRDAASIPDLLRVASSADPLAGPRAVESLGRIGRPTPEVLDLLSKALDRRSRLAANARRASATALALLSPNALPDVQRRIVVALAAAFAGDDDITVRGRAAIALGRIAGDPDTADAARGDAVAALRRTLDSSAPDNVRCYAAVALGLALHAEPCGVAAKAADEIRTRLRAALTAPADANLRAACTVAAGLARDPSAPSPLDAVTGVTNAADPARLVASFDDIDRSNVEMRAAVHALGRSGDAAAVAALRGIVEDATHIHPDLTRSYAAIAIGRICGDFGPLDRVTDALEFRAHVPALADLLLGY